MPLNQIGYRFQPGIGDVQGGNEATPRAGSPSNVRVLNLRIPKKPIAGAIAPQALLESPGGAGAPPGFLDDLLHIFQPPVQSPVVPPQTPSAPPLDIAPSPVLSAPQPSLMDDAPQMPSMDTEAPAPLPIQPPAMAAGPSPFQPQPDVPLTVSAPPPPRVLPGSDSGEPWWAMPQPPPPMQPAPVPEDTPRFTTPGERVPGGAYFYAPPLNIGGDESLIVDRPGFGRRPSPGRGIVG